MKTNSVESECHVQLDGLAAAEECELITSYCQRLIHSMALAMSADVSVADSVCDEIDQLSVMHGKKQIELLFAEIRRLIEHGELPPRFVAELAKHYLETTGRYLKVDLGVHSIELDRSFQVAIDVASRRNVHPESY